MPVAIHKMATTAEQKIHFMLSASVHCIFRLLLPFDPQILPACALSAIRDTASHTRTAPSLDVVKLCGERS
jgi:hypothetical protein